MKVYGNYALNDDAPLYSSYALVSENNWYYYWLLKPVVAYLLFIDMVGREEFIRAFHEFADRWAGKHPTPYDMFYTINDVLGENFNWFWKAWFFDFGYPDLALEMKGDQLVVKRVGEGSLPLPVKLIVENKDGSTSLISKSMKVWKNGEKEIKIKLENKNNIKSIRIDPVSIPDIDKSNNTFVLNN
jgi:hypothetical protein